MNQHLLGLFCNSLYPYFEFSQKKSTKTKVLFDSTLKATQCRRNCTDQHVTQTSRPGNLFFPLKRSSLKPLDSDANHDVWTGKGKESMNFWKSTLRGRQSKIEYIRDKGPYLRNGNALPNQYLRRNSGYHLPKYKVENRKPRERESSRI